MTSTLSLKREVTELKQKISIGSPKEIIIQLVDDAGNVTETWKVNTK